MNQEPLPCPFCGCPSFIRGGGTSRSRRVPYYVQCVNVLCAVEISDWDSRDSCLERWNTRSATVKQSLTVEHANAADIRNAALEEAAQVAFMAPITAQMDDDSAKALAFHAASRIRRLKTKESE